MVTPPALGQPTESLMLRALLVWLLLSLALAGCKRSYDVGDHVYVEWEKDKRYPAVIIPGSPGPGKYKVHFDGYDAIWDETFTRDKIKGFVEGTPVSPEPPEKVRAKAMQAVEKNIYKIGDSVKVEWHGTMYPARVIGIVGTEKYRIHYEGYGNEWDETVGLSRIQQK
jgi:hypothetical protein